jgi:hypothetical protein
LAKVLALLVAGQAASPAATITYFGAVMDNAGSQVTDWRRSLISKIADIDSDNIYGTLGAISWGEGTPGLSENYISAGQSSPGTFGWSLVAIAVNPDIGSRTQNFTRADYVEINNVTNAYAAILPGVTAISTGFGTVTFRLNGQPSSFTGKTVRLGLVHDFLEPTAVNDVNKRYTVVQTAGTGGGTNGVVTPGTRNQLPDIYFFDLTNVVPGDQFTITAYRNPATTASGGLASIGPFFLDIGPVTPTNPPVVTNGLTSFGLLLNEMVDRDQLAIWPNVPYRQLQASSSDPRDPGFTFTGRPAGYGNCDFANYLRWETNNGFKEWVMLDDAGPGVLTRWWCGGFPEAGNCRVYLDGSNIPTFVGNNTCSNLLGIDLPAVFGSTLAFKAAKGLNLYAPIPFQQRLKVTWDGPNPHGPGAPDGSAPPTDDVLTGALWYNIEYRKFPTNAIVTTYCAADPVQNSAALQNAQHQLNNPSVTGSVIQQTTNEALLGAGQVFSQSFAGPGAIRRIQVNLTGTDQVAALSNTWIELYFDGYRTARVPVGPFFGNGRSETSSVPLNVCLDFMRRVTADGDLACYWVMPFSHSAQVRLLNEGAQTVTAALQADLGSWAWDTNSMYFHASFRQEDSIKTQAAGSGSSAQHLGLGAEGEAMWNYLTVRGRGLYVGDTLAIRNNTGSWWGEGDEKIYVDGDSYPSHSGTGTEDYYGYAWGNSGLFQKRFVSQPISRGNAGAGLNGGVTVNSRVRLLDAIPFTNRFKFDLEIWCWNTGTVDYQATTYWYGSPGAVALRTVADLGADFAVASTGQTSQQVGVRDTAGTGRWDYYCSSHRNPSSPGAKLALLSWGSVGDRGSSGYGSGQALAGIPEASLPALGRTWLMANAVSNTGIQNGPAYHELELHPGPGTEGDTNQPPFVFARWASGTNAAGAALIEGALRNLVGLGDSVDFAIYHNGEQIYDQRATSATLPDTAFSLTRPISSGDRVDFVVGNNGAASALGDETSLRAVIALPDVTTNLPGGGIALNPTSPIYGTLKNVAITNLSASALLAGASSINGNPLFVSSVSTTNPAASVNLSDGTICYVPPVDYVGVDLFAYTVTDGCGNLAAGTAMVAVGDSGPGYNRVKLAVRNGQATLTYAGIPASSYVIETAANLSGGGWWPVTVTTSRIDGLVLVIEPLATNTMRYYRARQP